MFTLPRSRVIVSSLLVVPVGYVLWVPVVSGARLAEPRVSRIVGVAHGAGLNFARIPAAVVVLYLFLRGPVMKRCGCLLLVRGCKEKGGHSGDRINLSWRLDALAGSTADKRRTKNLKR